MNFSNSLVVVIVCVFFVSCQPKDDPTAVGLDGWLKGTTEEMLNELAEQQAGTGRAMIEVGYRYQELYWAGLEGNWEFAEHQIEEIEEAISLAMVRRPKRAASAKSFLEYSLPEMGKVVAQRDTILFSKAFVALTNACNACHTREEMPFIHVKKPQQRISPIRKP